MATRAAVTGAALAALPDPPGPRGGIPFRRLLSFRGDPLSFLERVHRGHGDVAHFRFGPRRFYLLAHPEHVREVLVVQHRGFIKSLALQRSRVLLGEGLLTSEGDHHLRQRRLAQPAFHRDRVAAMGDVMVSRAARHADGWRSGEAPDVGREMNRLALGIAGETMFGAEVDEEAEEIGRALSDALGLFRRISNPLAPLLDRIPVPGTLRFRRARVRLDETIYRMVAERRRSGVDRGDLLSMLLAARDEEGDGSGMSDAQLRDELLTLFLAGHETTANALAWSWHLLGANPATEAALHRELDKVLGGRAPSTRELPALPYTRGVLAEAMRLFPPAWAIGREPLQDFELEGYRIGRGSVVLMSPWLTHRDPRWWADPEAFRPERWNAEAEAAQPRFAYFPFGGGPRKCIGEGFAWTEGMLVLATLAQRWRLRPVPGGEPAREPLITLRPRGLRMRLEER
jgi:cytochrome P450